MKTDYVDVYFSHKYEDRTPVLETMEAYDRLIKAGKVQCIGASNFPIDKMKESQKTAAEISLSRYEVYQPEYHLMERDSFETEYQAYCLAENISVTSYFTLASGFLTGKYKSKEDTQGSTRGDRVEKYFTETGYNILKALDEIAKSTEPLRRQ